MTPAQPRWFSPLLLANLIAQIGIIVTGGLVRVTGSGLGCPSWPQCVPGSYTPTVEQAEGFHKYIEFGNRTLTGVLGILAVASLLAVLRYARHRHLVVAAALVLVGVLIQAVLGGITVWAGLHPATVSAHFLVSAGLVAAASYLYFTRHEPGGPTQLTVPPLVSRLGWGTAAVAALVLALGTVVTGSGPHSGDADTPARFGFDPRTISWLHADAVMIFLGLVIGMVVATRLTGQTPRARSGWTGVLHVTVLQGVVGYVQYLTKLPEPLVIVHMLLAGLLVVMVTRALLSGRARTASE